MGFIYPISKKVSTNNQFINCKNILFFTFFGRCSPPTLCLCCERIQLKVFLFLHVKSLKKQKNKTKQKVHNKELTHGQK